MHCGVSHPMVSRLRQVLTRRTGEQGFALAEAIIAMTLFLVIAASLVGLLTSALAAHGLARDRTAAEEVATAQLESIRSLPYDSVGTTGGNPPGTVLRVRDAPVDGLLFTVRTRISYVDDPIPGSYATAANYKKVSVTVTRTRDDRELARDVTYIAPPGRDTFGGVNKALIRARVVDFALSTAVAGADVDLKTGPSAPRNDATDGGGNVTFAALTPNPTSGPQAYYDLEATIPGYETIREDLPPNGPAHVQLAPGQTFSTALRVFRPATIYVELKNGSGQLYTSPATVTVSSSRAGQEFAVTGGLLTLTQLGGESIIPGLQYTVSARASSNLFSAAVTKTVPDNYPTDLTSTFTLTLQAFTTKGLLVQVRDSGGEPVQQARVHVVGGPGSIALSGVANEGGVQFDDVPVGPGYSITARPPSGDGSGTENATIGGSGTTVVTVVISGGGDDDDEDDDDDD
jgi:hypothetical protein